MASLVNIIVLNKHSAPQHEIYRHRTNCTPRTRMNLATLRVFSEPNRRVHYYNNVLYLLLYTQYNTSKYNIFRRQIRKAAPVSCSYFFVVQLFLRSTVVTIEHIFTRHVVGALFPVDNNIIVRYKHAVTRTVTGKKSHFVHPLHNMCDNKTRRIIIPIQLHRCTVPQAVYLRRKNI